MIRLFLSGDSHVGLRYGGHEKSAELSEARIEAFRGMVAKANDEACDLFAIAGDLFDSTKVPQRAIAGVAEHLGGFHGQVLIIPGNHDYYEEGSALWRAFGEAVRDRPNFHIMTEYRPCELDVGDERVIVYPAGCRSRHSLPGENNLGWIREEAIQPDGVYRVGLAHGAVEGQSLDREGSYFLMSREELNAIPVDVWLLGHTHVPFTLDGRILNAGTPVQTDVSCNTEGECFIVDIEGAEGLKPVKVRKFVSGTLRFHRLRLHVSAGALEETLREQLAGLPDNSVVDVLLSGAVSPEEYAGRGRILEAALDRFIEGTYDDFNLSRQMTRELIEAEFPETSFSARFLTALLDDPREAQMAYDLLKESVSAR